MIDGLVVAIDSSRREGGSVALAEGGELLEEIHHDPAQGYAESFFGLLDAALDRAQRVAQDIRALAVVSGPGSFTGLRIGVMTAKTLAFARGIPLFAARSLEILAARAASPGPGAVLALMDAGRDAVYAAAFESPGQDLVELGTARRLDFEELLPLSASLTSPLRVVPDGAPLLARLSGSGFAEASSATLLEPTPMGGLLARDVSMGRSWCREVAPASLLPVYLGLSQAERVNGLDLAEEVHRPSPPRQDGAH